MHVMDIIVVIGVAATIIQTGYIAVTYHNTAYQTVAPRPRVARRHFLLMSSLALISWAAVAFDYYDRHHSNPGDVLMGWGVRKDLTFFIQVNTTQILEYRDNSNLVLILRTVFADVDRMTDTNIDKSPPFTIVPDRLVIAISRPAHIRFLPLQQNLVEFNLVLLPTHISVDSVTSLADVQKFGGKILATPSALVELQPVEQK